MVRGSIGRGLGGLRLQLGKFSWWGGVGKYWSLDGDSEVWLLRIR